MQDLRDLLRETSDTVDLDVELLANGEYVRAVRRDLGARSTVISGLIGGITFSLDVPEHLDDEAITKLVESVVVSVRESVFLSPGVGPGQATGRPAGSRG